MKKFVVAMVVIILLGAVLAGVGCAVFFTSDFASQNVEYTEKVFETEESFSAIDFHLENSHKVTFEKGEKYSVKYYDSNVTGFSIYVENGKLTVNESGWSWKHWLKRLFYRLKSTDVVITLPEDVILDIKGSFNGAAEVILPSREYKNIDLDINGASNITANGITAESINLEISGATLLSLSGKANSLKTHASGAVNMRCDSFECPLIGIRSSGSSEINLSGKGSALNIDASGSGKIWAKNFALETVKIDASGSVDAELSVSKVLTVNASGSAHIYYWGDPQINKNISGSANVVKKG